MPETFWRSDTAMAVQGGSGVGVEADHRGVVPGAEVEAAGEDGPPVGHRDHAGVDGRRFLVPVPVRPRAGPGHVEGETAVAAHEVTGQAPGLDEPDAGEDEQGVFALEQLQREGGDLGVGGPREGLGPGR